MSDSLYATEASAAAAGAANSDRNSNNGSAPLLIRRASYESIVPHESSADRRV
jgi:hypothetical protein